MKLGDFLATAGAAGEGWRAAEMAEYDLAQRRLQTQQQLRLDRMLREEASRQGGQADYGLSSAAGLTLGSQLPVLPAMAEPAAPAPAAAPAAAAPAVTPTPYIAGLSLPPTTGLTQAQSDRIALAMPATAAMDVVSLPLNLPRRALAEAGPQLANLQGRLQNVIAGEQVARTDYQATPVSITPAYDKYVREPQAAAQARAVKEQLGRIPPTPEGKMPEFSNLLSSVIYVESKDNPNAIGKAGEIGLGQIKPDTARDPGFNIPSIFDVAERAGIPFEERTEAEARRLLFIPGLNKAYTGVYLGALLSRYNNNYEIAIAGYNWGPRKVDTWLAGGGNWDKLPASVKNHITKVVGRVNSDTGAAPAAAPAAAAPTAAGIAIPQGVQGAAPAPAAVPAAAAAPAAAAEGGPLRIDTSGVSEKYLANPEQISFDLNQARQSAEEGINFLRTRRIELERLARIQLASGTREGLRSATELRTEIANLDARALELRQGFRTQEVYLQGMQAISEIQLANDPRRAAAVASLVAGVPVNFQYREDGRLDILVNGVPTAKNMSQAQVIEQFRILFDPAYRKTVTEEKLKRAAQIFESQRKITEIQAGEIAKMTREIFVEQAKGNVARANELAKNRGIKFQTIPGEPRFVLMQQGDNVYRIDIEGATTEVDGTEVVKIEARPVAIRR